MAIIEIILKAIGIIQKFFDHAFAAKNIFTGSWEKERKRLLKKNLAMELTVCIAPTQGKKSEQLLELPRLYPGERIEPADWEEARRRVAVYRDKLSALSTQQALLISSNNVNLTGMLLLGWYINRKAGRRILFERNDTDKNQVFDLTCNQKGLASTFFHEEHDRPENGAKYRAIAVYVHANTSDSQTSRQPFETFSEQLQDKPVYRMRFISRALISEKDDLPSAAKQVFDGIHQARGSTFSESLNIPVYLCANGPTQMAVALGMQLGNDGNIVLCGFVANDKTYYEALRLGV